MKRIAEFILLSVLCISAALGVGFGVRAFAQSTKSALQTQIASCFPTQTVGAITPPITVTCMNAIIASMQQYAGVNAQTTTSYTFLQSDYGQLVTFANSSTVTATLPQAISSAFYPWNVFVKNNGTSNVNLTPIGSSVNSATTLAVPAGQSAWIVSDGANYQAWNAGASSSGGPVFSITASDTTLLISPTFGNVLAALNLGRANTWTATQSLANGVGITFLGSASTFLAPDAGTWNSAGITATGIHATGQFFTTFGTPTISTGTCGGGTNGTIATSGTNQSGKIVIGASATTSCSVSFSATLVSTPTACTFVPAGAPIAPAATWQTSSVNIQTISNTQFTLAGNALASTNWYYHCF